MRDHPRRYVVDASVGIKLFVAEEFSDDAHAVFARLAADPPVELFVPDLFYIECTNVLWKLTRFRGYSAERAREDLSDLATLMLHSVSTVKLMTEALDIASEADTTAYDACYAALARKLGVQLITADRKLARKLVKISIDTTWLPEVAH